MYRNSKLCTYAAVRKRRVSLDEELYYVLLATEEVKSAVFRYVFTYYYRTRIYTKNPFGLPPAVYRRLFKKKVA